MTEPDVNACCFDVFGTVVDWRSGVIRDGRAIGAEYDLAVDWAAVADAWRRAYPAMMNRVREGELPWTTVDDLHRMALDDVLEDHGAGDLPSDARDQLNRAWHRLDPWPDVIPGLRRLRQEYFVATLSNGNVRLLANMAKRAGLPWDLVLSAELARHYKTDTEAYAKAVELLDEDPEDVLMVACHPVDLRGAAAAGLRTAYIHRPDEWGPDADPGEPPDAEEVDFLVADLEDLATQLGV